MKVCWIQFPKDADRVLSWTTFGEMPRIGEAVMTETSIWRVVDVLHPSTGRQSDRVPTLIVQYDREIDQ